MLNITQEFVNEVLRNTNGKLLKKQYKNKWNKNNPTFGYCYIVCEAIYHYSNENLYPYCINYGETIGTHWYLKDDKNNVIDFTGNQFNFPVDYSKGIRKSFFKGSIKTNKGFISKRGYEVAKLLNIVDSKDGLTYGK